jgi:hypothetical protein
MDRCGIPQLFIMKNIVALAYTLPILEKIIVVRDDCIARYITGWTAAAPKLMVFFGERICNFV